MTVKRVINGTEISIELTNSEIIELFETMQKENAKKRIIQFIDDCDYNKNLWEQYIDELAEKYSDAVLDYFINNDDLELEYIQNAMDSVATEHGFDEGEY